MESPSCRGSHIYTKAEQDKSEHQWGELASDFIGEYFAIKREIFGPEMDKSRKMLTKVVRSSTLGKEHPRVLDGVNWAPLEKKERWQIDHYKKRSYLRALE